MDNELRTPSGDVVSLRARQPRLATAATERPLILLLQGPVGPFFGFVRRVFEQRGFSVIKVNFNAGDWLTCHGAGIWNVVGAPQDWAEPLTSFLATRRPAAIVLFGDGRPYHRIAIAAASRFAIPVWCLEEGYSRPHFVTCERGGNNGASPLCRSSIGAGRRASSEPPPYRPVLGRTFPALAVHASVYAVAKALGATFFRGNASHRQRGLWQEALLWTRSLCRKLVSHHANRRIAKRLAEAFDGRYFVLALQVHDDLNLLRHGRGWTMERLLDDAIASFAVHADSAHRLLIKVHPMDRGHRSYRAEARRIAARAGCSDRVDIVDDGSIGPMIRHALGVVTVNSTSGLVALNHGKPLLALGAAIYAHPGLAMDGADGREALDRFWRAPKAPDAQRVRLFMRRMQEESLINGSFYLRDHAIGTSEAIVARITAELARADKAAADRDGEGRAMPPPDRPGLASHAARIRSA